MSKQRRSKEQIKLEKISVDLEKVNAEIKELEQMIKFKKEEQKLLQAMASLYSKGK